MQSKLVFLTRENPFPPSGGAHLRDAHLIHLLREYAEIEILCFGDPGREETREEAPPAGVSVTRIPRNSAPLWQRALSTLRPEVQNGYSLAMENALRQRAAPGRILWISRLGMAQYLEPAKRQGYRIILDQHQVETRILWANAVESARQLRTLPRGIGEVLDAAQCKLFEGKMCQLADIVVAASEIDATRLLRLSPHSPIHVIPHSIDCAQYAPLRALPGRTLLFSGTLNYPPNLEGIQWFAAEVLPRLRSMLGLRMPAWVVAGSHPTAEITQLLKLAGAELHSDPPSLMPYLADAAIVIVPLRSGRSMRFKIIEAMAAGRAVVSTPRGAEGLILSPGYDISIADAADKFASAVARLIDNPGLRGELSAHAAESADARYDWRSARSTIDGLLQKLAYQTSKASLEP